jgi:SAM-dependent methyltransferase
MAERDYVLGTADAEIERLELQHLVWRPEVLGSWRRAGITRGSRVVDVGAGPGCATADLADIVGAAGVVLGVERSSRFIAAAERRCAERRLPQARFAEIDLMIDTIPEGGFDAAFCRWVASFVESPATLVERIGRALRPGGVAVFHEYGDYASWRLLPSVAQVDRFVAEVMASWRAAGGEPDVGRMLPTILARAGFSIRTVRPIVFTIGPADFTWHWPATFLRAGARRLVDLGRTTAAFAEELIAAFDQAERSASTIMTTPLVLEIVARR